MSVVNTGVGFVFVANTGVDFWLSERVKNLHEWLELMHEHYEEVSKRLKQK